MTGPTRPDYLDRSPEGLAAIFRHFARYEAPQLDSPLYEAFCCGVAEDRLLLEIAAHAPVGQTPVNMMFAAVQYLLLTGVTDRLASFYPTLSGCPVPSLQQAREEVFPIFRAFCVEHRSAIQTLVASRRVQTNVIQRCACLLPAFATVAAESPGQKLSLIEIGPSAGLNLNWDRYHYTLWGPAPDSVGATTVWGDAGSEVRLTTELRGKCSLPPLPPSIPVSWRSGIDMKPVDITNADAVTWLRALIWPEHLERHARLAAAIAVAMRHPPDLRKGDAVELLPAVMEEAPAGTMLTMFATSALYQIPRDGQRRLLQAMQHASQSRPVAFISMEGTGPDYAELTLTQYRDGRRATRKLANCNPHGRWIEWLAES